MCTRNIRFLRKGDKGDKGDRGRLPVPYGEYVAGTAYTATDLIAPYVLCEGQYYVMNKTTTWQQTSRTPKQDYAAYGSNATWILLEQYKAIFVELLMASFGKIASAIFYENLMFSQQGKINGSASSNYESLHTDSNGDVRENSGDFIPNFWVNFLTGKMTALNAVIKGAIEATSGSIGGFDININSIGTDGATSSHTQATLIEHAKMSLDSIDYSYGSRQAKLDASHRGNNLLYLAADYASLGPLAYLSTAGAEAIRVASGMFAGFRPHISTQNSGTLQDYQNVVICSNGAQATIYLPSSPKKGQMYLIIHTTSTQVTINGNGKSIRRLTEDGLTTVTTTTSGSIEEVLCNWDGSYWYLTYIKVS